MEILICVWGLFSLLFQNALPSLLAVGEGRGWEMGPGLFCKFDYSLRKRTQK